MGIGGGLLLSWGSVARDWTKLYRVSELGRASQWVPMTEHKWYLWNTGLEKEHKLTEAEKMGKYETPGKREQSFRLKIHVDVLF